MSELTREQVKHTLNLIVDHSLRAWKSHDEMQLILDHDAALRKQLVAKTQEVTDTKFQALNEFQRLWTIVNGLEQQLAEMTQVQAEQPTGGQAQQALTEAKEA